jgi:hypothetical protein
VHARQSVVARLRRLRALAARTGLEMRDDALRCAFAHAARGEHRERVRVAGRVRHARARGNHVERIAQHVRDDEYVHAARSCCAREAAARDVHQVLPHGVELADVGAGGEQETGRRRDVGEREPGQRTRE